MTEQVTGLSGGSFHFLHLLRNGVMTDLNTILNGLGGGGSSGISDVTSGGGVVSVVINGTTRVIHVNLASYSTTTAMNTAITAALTSYITQSSLNSTLTSYSTITQAATATSSALAPYSATAQAATATTAAFAPYSTTSAITALLNQKQATISVGTGCFLNGTTLSGYGLRWNATNVPSGTIEEIH